jgi:hypothetical protein
MDGPPDFTYHTVPTTYNGKSYTDFYVVCRIKYTQKFAYGSSTFDVVLVDDSMKVLYPHKTVHADNCNVTFNSSEVFLAFGRTVSK